MVALPNFRNRRIRMDGTIESTLSNPFVLFGVIVAILIGGVAGLLYLLNVYLALKLRPLQDALGGEVVSGFISGVYFKHFHEDKEQRIELVMGSRNSPPKMKIYHLAPPGFKMRVRREGIIYRGLTSLGLVKDVQIGDAAIDRQFLIQSDDEARTRSLFMDPEKRAAFLLLFDNKFTLLELSEDKVTAVKDHYRGEDLRPDRAREYLESIARLGAPW
jgi:hypothetical protein